MARIKPIMMRHRDGQHAAIQQRPDGKWALPGGRAVEGEAQAAAAARRIFTAAGGWHHVPTAGRSSLE